MVVNIRCPNCGKEGIPSTEEKCPECGFETRNYFVEKFPEVEVAFESEITPPSKPELWLVALVVFDVVAALVAFILAIIIYPGNGWLAPVIFAIPATFFGFIATAGIVHEYSKRKLFYTDFEAYQKQSKKEAKLWEAIEQKKREEEEQELSKLPACPICGSKLHVKRISTLNRAASVTAWGLASSKIGKQYKCENCGHMW